MKTLTKLAKKKQYAPILNTLAVRKGRITSTDLDMYISDDSDLPEGTYHAQGFLEMGPSDSGLPVDDMPMWGPRKELGRVFVQPAFILESMAWVAKAMSTEDVRYYLNGICFANDGAGIVATDGHRLHRAKFAAPWPVNPTYNTGMILPREAAAYLIALVKEKKPETIGVTFYENGFIFDVGTARLASKIVDGTFPDWRRVIPAQSLGETAFNPAELVTPLKEAKILAKVHGLGWNLPIRISCHNKTHLPGADKDWPFSSVVAAEACPNGIGFNLPYLSELCAGKMHYSTASGPVRIEGNGLEAVLMPLHV